MCGRRIWIISFLVITLFLFYSTNLAYSQGKGKHEGWTKGKRIGQRSENPPGWEKGLKKGWEKLTPPGWNNWSEKEKKKWEKGLDRAKKEINTRAGKKGWSVKDKEKATIALEFASRKGVPISHAKKVIQECIGQGLRGEDALKIGIALSEGVNKGVNFEALGSEVIKRLKAGYRGEKLVSEIHTMIEKRYKAKVEAQREKVGKPVGKREPKR